MKNYISNNYISYFDLLGTRGFCENPKTYSSNMDKFYDAILDLSCFIKGHGNIGIFSDCAYVESNDLQYILRFLTELRERLMSEGLFFNAVLMAGEIETKNIDDAETITGVRFDSNSIAELYVKQTQYRGIGIYIDESIDSVAISKAGFKTTRCFYMPKNSNSPQHYIDIALSEPRYGTKSVNNNIKNVLEALYSSYIKLPASGTYYLSILCNMLRSCIHEFKWNSSSNRFDQQPLEFNILFSMLSRCSIELVNLPGLEYLVFVMLDELYNCSELEMSELKDITKTYMDKIPCLKKYIYSLNEIPNSIFTGDNKNKFTTLCQNELSYGFVKKITNGN